MDWTAATMGIYSQRQPIGGKRGDDTDGYVDQLEEQLNELADGMGET